MFQLSELSLIKPSQFSDLLTCAQYFSVLHFFCKILFLLFSYVTSRQKRKQIVFKNCLMCKSGGLIHGQQFKSRQVKINVNSIRD